MDEKSTIKTVSIVGSGLMGSSIGLRASEYGYNVKFFDVSSEVRERLRTLLIDLNNEQKIKGNVSIHDNLHDAVIETDLIIVPGIEISTCKGHIIAYGVTDGEFEMGLTPKETVDVIHRRGGIAVPAHPFDYIRLGIN